MKKLILLVFLVLVTGSISAPQTAGAQTCTGYEDTAECHPEWAEARSACFGSIISETASTCYFLINNELTEGRFCSPNYRDFMCSPEWVNIFAGWTIARKAEENGPKHGFTDIKCKAEKAFFYFIDTQNGMSYFVNSLCAINGGEYRFGALALSKDEEWAWESVKTTLESEPWAIKCGGIENVQYIDGVYSCKPGTGPGPTPTPPKPPSSGNPNPSNFPGSIAYGAPLINFLSQASNDLKNQLNAVGGGENVSIPAPISANEFTASLSNLVSNITKNLQLQISSVNTPKSSGVPSVDLSFEDGTKSAVTKAGNLLSYRVTMKNVDKVSSFYESIPNNCSSEVGQKPWVVKSFSSSSVFSTQTRSCDANSTQIITLIGTNSQTGQTAASSVSIYFQP